MRILTIILCFLAFSAVALNDRTAYPDCTLTDHRGYVCPKIAENDPADTKPLAAPETLPKTPESFERTTAIIIDRKSCIDLGGKLINVWENENIIIYNCMKKD